MPIGHRGEKRPADLIGCAIKVAKLATGELKEDLKPKSAKTKSGHAGATARSASLTSKQRSAIARKAAKARWDK